MHAFLVRQDRFGEPRDAWQREVIPTPETGPKDVLVYVMATGINYNNVWAARGIPIDVIKTRQKQGEPGTGRICLIRSVVVRTPTIGGVEKGACSSCNILEESGYGAQIQKLQSSEWGLGGGTDLGPGSGFGSGESAGGRPPISRALESAAQRLDRATRARGGGTGEGLRQLNQRTGGVIRSLRSPGSQPGSFRTRTVRAGIDNVGGKPATQFYLPKEVKAEYQKLGVPTPTVDEPTAVVAGAVDPSLAD